MRFEELIKQVFPKLRGITRRINGRFAFFNEEDLRQEALAHLWVNYKNGKLFDKTNSYILQGCYFHLKNYMRKNCDKVALLSLENMVNEEGEAFDLGNILPSGNSEFCLELINCKMLIEKINNNGLTPREKEVFLLALEGLTTREIGDKLGISHVRVVRLKGKIKEKCRKYIELS